MPFRAIVGHRALVLLLTRATARDTLPQSLVFAGPDGVGKRMAALSLAQTMNCPNAAPVAQSPSGALLLDACGECSVCRRIMQGVHPDVIQLTSNIGVDDIRAAIESAGYRPFERKRRVVILDGADKLSSEIQNALLKTLEEPPPSSSFVLVTARPDALLPTVRSRCPMLRFGRLPTAEVERWLQAASQLLEPGETPRPKGRTKSGTFSRAASDRDLLGMRLGALGGMLRDIAATIAGAQQARVTNDLSPALQSWGARA